MARKRATFTLSANQNSEFSSFITETHGKTHGKTSIHRPIGTWFHLGILRNGLVQHAVAAQEGGSLGEVILGLARRATHARSTDCWEFHAGNCHDLATFHGKFHEMWPGSGRIVPKEPGPEKPQTCHKCAINGLEKSSHDPNGCYLLGLPRPCLHRSRQALRAKVVAFRTQSHGNFQAKKLDEI